MFGNAARLALLTTGLLINGIGSGMYIGGTIGIGTMIYAFGIGPLAHILIPIFQRVAEPRAHRARH